MVPTVPKLSRMPSRWPQHPGPPAAGAVEVAAAPPVVVHPAVVGVEPVHRPARPLLVVTQHPVGSGGSLAGRRPWRRWRPGRRSARRTAAGPGRPAPGRRPQSSWTGMVSSAKSAGATIGLTPSAARALSTAARTAARHRPSRRCPGRRSPGCSRGRRDRCGAGRGCRSPRCPTRGEPAGAGCRSPDGRRGLVPGVRPGYRSGRWTVPSTRAIDGPPLSSVLGVAGGVVGRPHHQRAAGRVGGRGPPGGRAQHAGVAGAGRSPGCRYSGRRRTSRRSRRRGR